jgi:DNA-binding NtrC family response regulator
MVKRFLSLLHIIDHFITIQKVFKIEIVFLSENTRMKILIIEDEKGLRESIEEYFMEAGNICETASNYQEAISKVSLYSYDCILLDITLPGGNGIEILKNTEAK